MDASADAATAVFPPSSDGVRAARRFATAALGGTSIDREVALVVSELAANAVLHAATAFRVTVERQPGGVRIEVEDGTSALPVTKDHGDSAPTGRGLKIVDSLVSCWGSEHRATGKVVWAELREPSDAEVSA